MSDVHSSGGTYHLTLFGYFARFQIPVPYPQSQYATNHAVFEGSAIRTDRRGKRHVHTRGER